MYYSCKELFQLIYEEFSLELLAGSKGLSALAAGCCSFETPEDLSCIKIGSLVFTTGIASHRYPNWLLRFLEAAKEHKASAVIFILGEHLKSSDFSQKSRTYCEEHNLPLVVMDSRAKNIPLSKLYAACEDLLYEKQQNRFLLESALQGISRTGSLDAEQAAFLTKADFPPEDKYYVCAISCTNENADYASDTPAPLHFPDISRSLRDNIVLSALNIAPFATALYQSGGITYALYKCANSTLVKKFSQFISIKLQNICTKGTMRFGVSDSFTSLASLNTANKQAKTALQLASAKETEILTYHDLGIFRVLLTSSDTAPLKAYINEQLGTVKAYDAKHKSDFSKTLYLYILHSGSIQAVAAASGCHRNTINHRIRMMKERMGYALDEPQNRYEILLAFLVEEYCKIND